LQGCKERKTKVLKDIYGFSQKNDGDRRVFGREPKTMADACDSIDLLIGRPNRL
jgi:hypothetical protein